MPRKFTLCEARYFFLLIRLRYQTLQNIREKEGKVLVSNVWSYCDTPTQKSWFWVDIQTRISTMTQWDDNNQGKCQKSHREVADVNLDKTKRLTRWIVSLHQSVGLIGKRSIWCTCVWIHTKKEAKWWLRFRQMNERLQWIQWLERI